MVFNGFCCMNFIWFTNGGRIGVLRFILALAVVITHGGGFFDLSISPPAPVAVQAFFIISGFYMSLVLYGRGKGKYHSIKLFYSNRFFRLFPTYISFFALALLIHYWLFSQQYENGMFFLVKNYIENFEHFNFFTKLSYIISNITMFGQDILHFTSINPETGQLFWVKTFSSYSLRTDNFMVLPQAWSLSLELMFYALAPFILKRRLWVLMVIFLLSIWLRVILYKAGYNKDPWSYRFFPLELAMFVLGAISHRLYNIIPFKKTPKWLIYTIGFVPLLISFDYHYLPPIPVRYFFNTPQIIFYLSLFVCIPFLFYISKSIKWDRQIGELSYPIYLIHLMLIPLFSTNNSPSVIKIIIVSIVISILTVRFIDGPVDKWRQSKVLNQ